MRIGYARVSTEDQRLDRQVDALERAGCERVFVEKASGMKDARPELDRMLDTIREGDDVVVAKLDRISRSTKHLIEAFHTLWDSFPGMARLINDKHMVLASNPVVESKGFVAGANCAEVGDPAIHRGCKHAAMFRDGTAQTDIVLEDRIRGWIPVTGRRDICVHFALPIPKA